MKTQNRIEIIRELIVGDEINQIKNDCFRQSDKNEKSISKLEQKLKKELKSIDNRLDEMSKLINRLNENLEKIELKKTDKKSLQKLLVGLSERI